MNSGYSIALPVLTARPTPMGEKIFEVIGEVYGTAFSIGNGYMLTAGHVIKSITAASLIGTIGLREPNSIYQKAAQIIDSELLPHDLAIFKVDFLIKESTNWFYTLPWQKRPLDTFDPVRCLGYPYGMHTVEDRKSLVLRGFQGYVVADLFEFKPCDIQGDPFAVYELSFNAPRGLSGSPLLSLRTNNEQHIWAAGIIIGNSKSRMLILDSEEINEEDNSRTILEQYESLSFGIAVQAKDIFNIYSQMLGSTIYDYLGKNNLLV